MAKATKDVRRLPGITVHTSKIEIRAEKESLPDGVCAQISGVALVYNERDAYGTVFRPGCLDVTRSEKLAAGRIKLFDDHTVRGAARRHVGVVREMPDAGSAVLIQADIFDTDAGREIAEYCKSCVAAGAFTGFSVGFWERAGGWVQPADGSQGAYEYTEIELDEVSIEPTPAVQGAELMQARGDPSRLRALFDLVCDAVPVEEVKRWTEERVARGSSQRTEKGGASQDATSSAEAGSGATIATGEERRAAIRRSYVVPTTT